MMARPFELSSCPKVPRAWAGASRRVLAALPSIPGRWDGDLPPLGPARLTFTGLASGPGDGQGVEIALDGGGIPGRLVVGASLSAALVDSLLAGRQSHFGVRRLGPAERGLLAGILAGVPARLGWSVRLDVVAAPVGGEKLGLAFWLETRVARGEIRIEVPGDGTLPRGDLAFWDSATRARLGRLPVTAAVEIALTDLDARDIMTVASGDAVVFEGRAATELTSVGPWPGRLGIRSGGARYQIPIDIDPQGEARVTGVMSSVYEEGRMSASNSGSGFDAATVLAGAPVEVVAELGRITLRGDELLGLAAGAVLRVAAGRKTITLRAAGEPWAEGEIVDVEGELGVRVTRVLSR